MEIKCIITDDEPVARKGLKSYIEKVPFLSLQAECESSFELNTILKNSQPDVVFLDIEMPELSGIEYLSTITHPPKIIIVSAYEQYALQGYELEVFDYLLKPVSFNRFLKSVNRLHDQLVKTQTATDHIFIKTDKKTKKVLLKDILFIEGKENYIMIYTHNSKEIVYCTLRMMEDNLPQGQFVSIHRSYIVNIAYIEAIEGNQLEVGSYKIPIARNLKENIYKQYIEQNLVTRANKKK
ncbi:LytTR family DNA-binding domain-containing protein [[Flexibacter] sp. ATCC 35208]|uniref:LytR/AlgR family response regulator transcription factor n=1 Tax=[Flexibacter] sp. ATCC 35208 TaxID=1936242 RepID=UPI0009D3256E|nr:LytTR family DNA-binding domain-containing protein [[Flexibacter] sp. ATCC 35208]OMP76766.1 DNA-binding response regulator [[Flexibacter] sp. ATCC 35208]